MTEKQSTEEPIDPTEKLGKQAGYVMIFVIIASIIFLFVEVIVKIGLWIWAL